MEYETTKVHIDTIRAWDTILHNGKLTTICKTDIKRKTFMGTTLLGDSYHSGNKPVLKVTKLNGRPIRT